MDWFTAWLVEAPWWQTVPAALLENALILGAAVFFGEMATRLFSHRRVSPPAPPMSRTEIIIATVTFLTNSLTTLVGLYLWRRDIIRFRIDRGPLETLADIVLLLLAMDGAMYALHRVAHWSWIYPWLHKPHHEHVLPRPLTLFILNPLENLAFGGLMLTVFALHPFTIVATGFFLTFNVASGVVGHLGVEPLPDWWVRTPLVRNITGGTFHVRHHDDVSCNYGFYTVIWDRLCGTLERDYWGRFGKLRKPSVVNDPDPAPRAT